MKPPDRSVLCNSHPREALGGRIKETQIKGSGFSPWTPTLLLSWRGHTHNLHLLVSSQNALPLKMTRHLSDSQVTIKRQGTCPLESVSCPAPPFTGTPSPALAFSEAGCFQAQATLLNGFCYKLQKIVASGPLCNHSHGWSIYHLHLIPYFGKLVFWAVRKEVEDICKYF